MAEQSEQDSAVSKPTYKTDETAQAFATLLDKETASNEEPKTELSDKEESNLQEDQAELSDDDITADDIVENEEARLESQEELYDVTINGNNQKVTLDELLKGYSRESDYTKKTQDLGNQRRELDTQQESLKTEQDAVKQARDDYAEKLKVLNESLNADQNIDWVKLAQDDPQTYAVQKAEYDRQQELKTLAQQEQQRIQQEQRKEQEKVYKNYIQVDYMNNHFILSKHRMYRNIQMIKRNNTYMTSQNREQQNKDALQKFNNENTPHIVGPPFFNILIRNT